MFDTETNKTVIGLVRHFYDAKANTKSYDFPYPKIQAIDENQARRTLEMMSIPLIKIQTIIDEAARLAKKFSDDLLTVNIREAEKSVAAMNSVIDHVRNLKTKLLGHPECFSRDGFEVIIEACPINDRELEVRGLADLHLSPEQVQYSSLRMPYITSLLDWFDVLIQYANKHSN
jgi:hypothetical protein